MLLSVGQETSNRVFKWEGFFHIYLLSLGQAPSFHIHSSKPKQPKQQQKFLLRLLKCHLQQQDSINHSDILTSGAAPAVSAAALFTQVTGSVYCALGDPCPIPCPTFISGNIFHEDLMCQNVDLSQLSSLQPLPWAVDDELQVQSQPGLLLTLDILTPLESNSLRSRKIRGSAR